MKITAGATARAFADTFGVDLAEVVEWISTYVNGPWSDSLAALLEPTEQERLASIKAYIDMRLANSVTARVRAAA